MGPGQFLNPPIKIDTWSPWILTDLLPLAVLAAMENISHFPKREAGAKSCCILHKASGTSKVFSGVAYISLCGFYIGIVPKIRLFWDNYRSSAATIQ
jgi:hypothetical protein